MRRVLVNPKLYARSNEKRSAFSLKKAWLVQVAVAARVDKFRVRNATPSIRIEADRNGAKCLVNELIDSDFENMVLDGDFIRSTL